MAKKRTSRKKNPPKLAPPDDIDRNALWKRLEGEGRWKGEGGGQAFRVTAKRDLQKQGFDHELAVAHSWAMLAEAFPPLSQVDAIFQPVQDADRAVEAKVGPSVVESSGGRVSGLDVIPRGWGELPAAVSLQAELAWVQSNRLWIVQETSSGGFKVNLRLAKEPAPSRSAIGWLETSIKFPSKFADSLIKKATDTEDDSELVRRERKSLEEIGEILDRMKEA